MITNDVDEAVLMADRIVPLTMGPKATLSDPYRVEMARPRERQTLNDHPEFKHLKSEITNFMMSISQESRDTRDDITPMPDVRPKDFSLPTAGFRPKNKISQPTSAA